MVRILIADDHDIVRSGLRRILESHSNWEVVAEAGDGGDAIRKAVETRPDIAVIDYSLPMVNGIEVTGIMRVSRGSPVARRCCSRSPGANADPGTT